MKTSVHTFLGTLQDARKVQRVKEQIVQQKSELLSVVRFDTAVMMFANLDLTNQGSYSVLVL